MTRTGRVVDLFCGAGGLSEGFRQAGYDILAGLDFDPDAIATFARNFPGARPILGDLRSPDVREKVLSFSRGAAVVVGGPPCQAWSQVRNHARLIDDPRNGLYREFVHIVREIRPAVFVMENVTGIDQMGARQQMLDDLSLSGEYEVLAQVLDAADHGVPQTRKRLLFIGARKNLGLAPPTVAGTGATSAVAILRQANRKKRYRIAIRDDLEARRLASVLADPEDATVVTAAQAISDLRVLRVGNRVDELKPAHVLEPESAYQRLMRVSADDLLTNLQVPRINQDTRLRLEGVPPGGNHRDLAEELLERYITGKKWGHDNGSGRLSRRHFYAYRRLHPEIWAWTLNTKADAVYHYSVPRALSVREFARLQSFPDSFTFVTDPRKGVLPGRIDGGAAHSRYRQVGNAVPPLLARAVAEAITPVLASLVPPCRKTA